MCDHPSSPQNPLGPTASHRLHSVLASPSTQRLSVKINGFISVNGNGATTNNLVINYEGVLKRGPYMYNADYSQVAMQDLELAEMILSHLNLKESRHIYFTTE